MSGGMGRRMLSKEEKPMLMVKGKPMIDHVFTALKNSNCFEKILIIGSVNTPNTTRFLANIGVEIINSSGSDYVKDLNYALELIRPNKVLVISGDMPLIDSNTIKKIELLVMDEVQVAINVNTKNELQIAEKILI